MTATPWIHWLVSRLVRLQLALLVVMLLSIIANRFSLLPFAVAFGGFGLALLATMALAAIGVAVLPRAWWRQSGYLARPALVAAVAGSLPLAAIVSMVGVKGFQAPAIHDITTDTHNPPQFYAAPRERQDSDNTLVYPGEAVARLQRDAYPQIVPLSLAEQPAQVFARARQVCRDLGWRVLLEDASAGRIEAVEETRVFGFKDDLVIRIVAEGGGSRVDVRSVSRVGRGDLGANAARIQRFLSALVDYGAEKSAGDR